MRRMLLALIIICMAVMPVNAQFTWLPGGTYDRSIQTPESVLGYEIGTYFTEHYQMIDYIHELEKASDKVKLFKYGITDERRELYLVVIAAPENIRRLEEIRTTIGSLKDPRTTSVSEAETIANDFPAIGWLNFGTDGNETAALETAVQIMYQLTAGQDALTRKILENVVVIVNPSLSPDSHQRYVTWVKSVTVGKTGSPSPDATSHHREWLMNTNQNHYSIDVNRDAFALSIDVTQQAIEAMHHWNPQIWVDNHGTPDEYFFAPPVTPINSNFPPSLLKWLTEIGRNNAGYFDKHGWTFVKDEKYDLYYPGYFDSYPSFSGAIGMTYETDGGGNKALVFELPDGTYKTLRDGVHHHFTTNLSTLEVLADNKKSILADYYSFRKSGMDEADTEQFKQYVLIPGEDKNRLDELAGLFIRHKIEIYKTESAVSSRKSQTYFDRVSKRRDFPAGSYIIPLKQPQKRLIKALLEPDPTMEDKFLNIVAEITKRNSKLGTSVQKEREGFYDVTAWALPLTYGIEAAFTEDVISLPDEWKVNEKPAKTSNITGGRAGFAYLFSAHTDAGMGLAGKLMQRGYKTAIALKQFTNSGIDFPKGTFVVRVQRNPEDVHLAVEKLTAETGAEVFAVNTAWGEKGISLGSDYVRDLRKPNIMVLTHNPVSSTGYGAVWHLLESRYGLEFTAVRAEYFADVDLSKYTAIVFPDGSASGYAKYLGDNGVNNLKSWIRAGGTFVGLKGGALFAVQNTGDMTDVKQITKIPSEKGDDDKEQIELKSIPGAIFKAIVNNDYYLGIGQSEEIAVQIRSGYFLSPTKKGANVVTFPDNSYIMGFKWPETEKHVSGKPYLMDIPAGRGHLILFADDPTFRNYWRGLDRLFLSAVLLPGMR